MTTTSKFWIGTSWKMTKTSAEALVFAQLLKKTPGQPQIQRFIIPSFTSIREIKTELRETDIKVGAQNMHWADEGPWTGEVSPVMLKECGVDLVELGHSERRANFAETNASVGLKTEAAVRHGLVPLICVGETASEKAGGQSDDVLRTQIEGALGALNTIQISLPILIAYEPVWAIGVGGIPASPHYVSERHSRIKEVTQRITGHRLPCLYGGSVNLENCAELVSTAHVDGLFIGRAAWQVEGYLEILSRCFEAILKKDST